MNADRSFRENLVSGNLSGRDERVQMALTGGTVFSDAWLCVGHL